MGKFNHEFSHKFSQRSNHIIIIRYMKGKNPLKRPITLRLKFNLKKINE